MSTIETKLNTLVQTKSSIRNKIIEMGIGVPGTTEFKDYPDYIGMIKDMPDTTTDQDLLQMCDIVKEIGTGNYENKTYTEEEIQEVKNLLNLIIEGGNNNE